MIMSLSEEQIERLSTLQELEAEGDLSKKQEKELKGLLDLQKKPKQEGTSTPKQEVIFLKVSKSKKDRYFGIFRVIESKKTVIGTTTESYNCILGLGDDHTLGEMVKGELIEGLKLERVGKCIEDTDIEVVRAV